MNAPPLGSPSSFRSFRPSQGQQSHRRTDSQSSNVSAASAASAPTATMQALMQTIRDAPKGSKMGEDAAKALIAAERARFKATGVELEGGWPLPQSASRQAHRSPAPSPSPGPSSVASSSQGSSSQIHSPRPISRASHRSKNDSVSSIGAMMLASPGTSSPVTEEDPFHFDAYDLGPDGSVTAHVLEFDELLDAPYGDGTVSPSWLNPPPTAPPDIPLPPLPPMRSSSRSGPRHPALSAMGRDVMISGEIDRDRTPMPEQQPPITSDLLRNRSQYLRPRRNAFVDVLPTQNAIGIFWRGEHQQQFSLVTEAVGLQGTDDVFPVHVAPQNTQVVEIPRRWSGFVQKLTGVPGDPATRCEISFDGQAGLTFFGVTYAYGHNGGVVIRSHPNDAQAGSPFRAAHVAANGLCIHDRSGLRVLKGTVQARPQERQALHKFYRDFFETPEQGSILVDDQTNIVATRDRHLLLDFT